MRNRLKNSSLYIQSSMTNPCTNISCFKKATKPCPVVDIRWFWFDSMLLDIDSFSLRLVRKEKKPNKNLLDYFSSCIVFFPILVFLLQLFFVFQWFWTIGGWQRWAWRLLPILRRYVKCKLNRIFRWCQTLQFLKLFWNLPWTFFVLTHDILIWKVGE